MQGWPSIIPTQVKIDYLNALLQVGFHTIDFGSFVSPKAIPQMADTTEVLKGLDLANTNTQLLAIIANTRGAETACAFPEIKYLGFPFSISETFQQRNTNSGINESLDRVREIQELCKKHDKTLVVYISMAFGNPYGDVWSAEIVYQWIEKLAKLDIEIFSLADTVGVANPEQVYAVTHHMIKSAGNFELGVHLHATSNGWQQKLKAAWEAGCRRFDGALKGIGGCPMAGNDLVGNIDTELMIEYFTKKGHSLNLNTDALVNAKSFADRVFIIK